MRIFGREIIEAFKLKHPASRRSLDRWVALILGGDFGKPSDLKETFGANVDFVGKKAVFDVGGNKIRTVTKFNFGERFVIVTHVLTHYEYDLERWKE